MREHALESPGRGDAESNDTVLLVDDTELLREVIGEGLRNLGYTVLLAAGGDEALRLADAHRGPIHVLLTDVSMPGMSGTQLAEQIATRHVETRIVFMSGSGPLAMDDPTVVKAGGVVLEKPFTQDQLANTLRDVLRR